MFNGIGYSVYLSTYESIKETLRELYVEGSYVFTSFHISEEFGETYVQGMRRMCGELREMGYRLLGDVSAKTLKAFGFTSMTEFAARMGISILRIDYGLSEEEITDIGGKMPICINASTVGEEAAGRLKSRVPKLYAMHNFYPRPETGLDEAFFAETNEKLRRAGIKVLAFVPGNVRYRGPICEGLPTLEYHRGCAPYAAYADLKQRFGVDGVFVGDGIISGRQAEWIRQYEQDGILRLPATLTEAARALPGRTFTIRADSPRWLKRFQESREYSCFGQSIAPVNCAPRPRGSITVDNSRYKRYSGEIQLILEQLPQDSRVNVIGQVEKKYDPLLGLIINGSAVQLVDCCDS